MPQDFLHPNDGVQRSPDRYVLNDADDMSLMTRIESGQQEALSALFDRYGSMVYSVALRVLKNPGDAEDVMQDIFIHIWKKPSTFVSGRGSLGGWLLVVTRNRSIDVLRRRKTFEDVELFTLPSSGSLSNKAERGVLLERVRGVVQTLPEEQKYSMELAFFEGLTHSEIAEKTGDPLGTVKTRIRLALITIRKALKA